MIGELKKRKSAARHACAAFFFALFVFGFFGNAEAQEKSYSYDKIDFIFQVNKDTTVDVTETETFNFKGNFHNAFRELSLNKVDDITDIEVIDPLTSVPVEYSIAKENGEKKIEWHYDLTDTTYTWVIKYKLHGAISFLEGHDELYWNLFTDFEVPIGKITAAVRLPEEVPEEELQGFIYRSMPGQEKMPVSLISKEEMLFVAEEITAFEKVTIAAGWPKGIIDQSAYFKDAAQTWWPVILAFFIIILTGIFAFTYWYRTEKMGKGRGTIIPQYEPPQGLRPAMAEVLIKEGVSKKTWPATLIDLAVRGYVTIEEDDPGILQKTFGKFLPFTISSKDYLVRKGKDPDMHLEEYEADYLRTILYTGNGYVFSTKRIKSSQSESSTLYKEIKEVEKKLYKEVEHDTGAFEKKISREKIIGPILGIAFVALVWISIFFSDSISVFLDGGKFILLSISVLFAVIVVTWLLQFEARLSREGAIMREDWLGFKMYLETAEKYRLQNLTPELFEKYLPYAMIFGIEKKWAKAFESLDMNPPSWYHSYGAYSTGSSFGSSNSGFSASAFSASLSSSFSSAMGSSGAGGASGGGGAGGGGGGGGGGAS